MNQSIPVALCSFGLVSLCSINSEGWLVHSSLLLATCLHAVVVQKFSLIKCTRIVPWRVPLLTKGFVAVNSGIQALLRSDSSCSVRAEGAHVGHVVP